ncbi:HAD family hydrolase [Amphritea pacifica]|uniref:HAD family hydrolase n=1 Tax=Amphritea pacifica TaxID=2811233 RepID=A0ABS2W3H2_9GAMM|nr:HAD family hydrolase [Amphritea pacifica]MBN0986052.1 HAD family hydrolase [Amphritea pacifica]MBN1006832.1 HAD family hydrolase [Amphritea pacifica]
MIETICQAGYWVFDLDGTLTHPVHDFERIRSELGLPAGCDILATIADRPEPERQALNYQLDQWEYFYADQVQPAIGVNECLEFLGSKGCLLGILTRNKREVALHCLEVIGVSHLFNPAAVLGRDDAQAKPDPHGVRLLLERWQARPEQAVMVGDFRYDLEVGRAAGVATVHVDARCDRQWPELTDLRVGTLSELHQLLRA